jgi:hypothetical protein
MANEILNLLANDYRARNTHNNVLHELSLLLGAALGLTVGEAKQMIDGRELPAPAPAAAAAAAEEEAKGVGAYASRFDLPSDVALLYENYLQLDYTGEHAKIMVDLVSEDEFLAPLYYSRACKSCGLVPRDPAGAFLFCSLCRDPAAGRFCCKDPCFAAFWKGGHKHECAGRDKLKKRKDGSGAG